MPTDPKPTNLLFSEGKKRAKRTPDVPTTGRERREAERIAIPADKVVVCEAAFLGDGGFVANDLPALDLAPGGIRLRVSTLRRRFAVGGTIRLEATYPGGHFTMHGVIRHLERRLLRVDLGVEFERDEIFRENEARLEACLGYYRRPGEHEAFEVEIAPR